MSLPLRFGFLRPRGHQSITPAKKDAYILFYSAAKSLGCPTTSTRSDVSKPTRAFSADTRVSSNEAKPSSAPLAPGTLSKSRNEDVRQRLNKLESALALKYPRIKQDRNSISCAEFKNSYAELKPDESRESETVTLRGRVYSTRVSGSKLAFVDIVQDGSKVQGLCNLGRLASFGANEEQFKEFNHLVRRGDIISITGVPTRTKRGELSVNASAVPIILTPALASLPAILEDPMTRIKNRHADMLLNQRVMDTLKLRSHVIQYLRDFLLADKFLEVQTPIIADSAGGATARPFTTIASELSDKTLALRIAPELWLKRMILGGMDRVFEIGPAFRNEGIDATHNPEFTTCEFYKSFADLEELIIMTEHLVSSLANHTNNLITTELTSLTPLDVNLFSAPFNRVEFIPGIETAINRKLPDLESDTATSEVISLFKFLSLPIPSSPTLPRLLDRLCATYLEPSCSSPTFIMHHPACLGPLAKSFTCPKTNQQVSARVELFVQHREIANMYEEENSPIEQRRKFVEQGKWKDEENEAVIDESYVEALEWGLPPTGGWGAGIERLVMLMSGAGRIGDVLSFGTLRSVVGLASQSRN